MSGTIKFIRTLAILMILTSCGFGSSHRIDGIISFIIPGFSPDNKGGDSATPPKVFSSVRWAESMLPLNLVAPLNRKVELEPSLKHVCDQWNEAVGRVLITYSFADYTTEITSIALGSGKNHYIYFQNDWKIVIDDDSSLAVTIYDYYQDDNTMASAAMYFNNDHPFYYEDGTDNNSNINIDSSYDFESVLLHEAGHILGLGHSAEKNSVMTSYTSKGATKRNLSNSDKTEIIKKYQ